MEFTKKIKSLTECYSMQPAHMSVTSMESFRKELILNTPNSPKEDEIISLRFNDSDLMLSQESYNRLKVYCKEIKEATLGIEWDQSSCTTRRAKFYVGYNFFDQPIFKYLASTVNVHYYHEMGK